MHVCMVLPDPYPPDIRVTKEARALLDAGHEVSLLCRGQPEAADRETVDGIDVVRLGESAPRDRAARLGSAACNLATGAHPRWALAIRRLVRERDADVVHVHDLPLVRTALWALRGSDPALDVPVVADLHENFPEAVRQWRRPHFEGEGTGDLGVRVDALFNPISRWKRIERAVLPQVDRVLTVCEEAARHYHRDCRVLPARTTVVGNTVDLKGFDAEADPADEYADADEFLVTYVGGFGPHRGLETAIEGIAAADAEGKSEGGPEPHLLLVGAGADRHREQLEALISELGVDDRVTFTGWVDFEDVPRYMAASDACLVPHASTPHTDTTVPHKLFQYMAVGAPVIVSDVPPLKRIVEETESGLVVPADDGEAMGEAISTLASDSEEASRLGENGREAVRTKYNWGADAERLVATYEDLVGE
ncbi:glycosyltransferase family 4 protein [Halobium salinum]|uniref:Glycosyltransferase family 4 protein n=1 Tax=Halobium salinum TaxID=1364940 RepID=A0ABD5PBY7_9EURY|nr:glycosyltransferase family 4 protein [Halobium salinum]